MEEQSSLKNAMMVPQIRPPRPRTVVITPGAFISATAACTCSTLCAFCSAAGDSVTGLLFDGAVMGHLNGGIHCSAVSIAIAMACTVVAKSAPRDATPG